jgi:hypothetical protein
MKSTAAPIMIAPGGIVKVKLKGKWQEIKQDKKPIRILINVDGGCLRSVYADQEIVVELLDEDNLHDGEGFSREAIEKLFDEKIKGMTEFPFKMLEKS